MAAFTELPCFSYPSDSVKIPPLGCTEYRLNEAASKLGESIRCA